MQASNIKHLHPAMVVRTNTEASGALFLCRSPRIWETLSFSLGERFLNIDFGEMYSSPYQVQYTKSGFPWIPKKKKNREIIIDVDCKALNTNISKSEQKIR